MPNDNVAHLRKSESIFERAAYYAAHTSHTTEDVDFEQAQKDCETLIELADKSKWMKGEVAGFFTDQRRVTEVTAAGFAGVIGMAIIRYVGEKQGVEFDEDEMVEIKKSVEQICKDALVSQTEIDLGVISEMIEMRLQSLVDRHVEGL